MGDAFAQNIMTLVAVLIIVGSSIANSQTTEPYDQAKLEAFATAAINTNKLMARWQPLVDQANNAEEAISLTEQANEEIVMMIENTPNLDLAEFQEISEAAQADPALMNRINEIARQLDEF